MREKLVAVVAFAVLFAFPGFARNAAHGYAQAVETAVAKGHPRLFADADAFVALRASADDGTLRARAIGKVIKRAELIVGEPPLTRVMYGHRMLRTSRAALGRISTLAMAHRLSGDTRFLDRVVVELKAVCAFEDWNPRHFLDTAEMSFAVALGYDWLYHDLPEDVRTELLDALVEKGFRPAQKGGHWARTGTNWAQVCRGAAIALSLVLADWPEMRGDCVRMLKASVKALHKPMDLLEPDGCYPEGVGYWRYGISFNVYAIAMMESACGTDFGLSGKNGFRKTAEYPNLATGPLGMTIGYSDCGTSRGALPVLWWFAKRFGRPDILTEHEVRAWDAAPEGDGHYPPVELFWMDGRKGGTVPSSLPLVWEGRGKVPIAVLRSGFGAEDAFVGLKGGRPRTNHGHMDGGNFVLDMGGVRWAWDLPAEYYPRIEEMGTVSLWKMDQDSSRWSLLRLNAFGHNVPQIGGAQQMVDGFASFTVVTNVPEPTGEMDLSSLYPAAKKVVRRCTLAPDGKRFAVRDVFDGLVPGTEVTWKFITKAGARADGGRLALTESGRTLEAVRDGTAATEWKIAPAEGPKPLNSPNPGFSVVSFSVKADESGRACAAVVFSLASACK